MSDDAPTDAGTPGGRGPVGHATGVGGHRVQVTVFLEPAVHRAAKRRAAEAHLSLSATVAEAAKESLLSSYRSDREQELLRRPTATSTPSAAWTGGCGWRWPC